MDGRLMIFVRSGSALYFATRFFRDIKLAGLTLLGLLLLSSCGGNSGGVREAGKTVASVSAVQRSAEAPSKTLSVSFGNNHSARWLTGGALTEGVWKTNIIG